MENIGRARKLHNVSLITTLLYGLFITIYGLIHGYMDTYMLIPLIILLIVNYIALLTWSSKLVRALFRRTVALNRDIEKEYVSFIRLKCMKEYIGNAVFVFTYIFLATLVITVIVGAIMRFLIP